MELDKLPEILTAQNIATYLMLSRNRVYELFQLKESAGGMRVIRVGASIRVRKADFVKWMEKQSLAHTS